MKRSIAILGLGKYGRSLAEQLYSMGADVLVADHDEELIHEFAGKSTAAICAELTNEDEVAALGLDNMDIVVSAMGGSPAASIMVVAVAKEQGVPLVVAKASTARMSSILKKVGADKIVDPEEEGGIRSARILMSSTFLDFMQLDENLSLVEMRVKKEWAGKSLMKLDLRKKFQLNVIAVKEKGGRWSFIDPTKALSEQMVLLVVLEKSALKKFT